jgi:hypothetical protein
METVGGVYIAGAVIVGIILIIAYARTREPFVVNLTRYVTLHYTKWCHCCEVMRPVWERVKIAVKGSGIEFSEHDEGVSPTPGIVGYPTIRLLDENGRTHDYRGQADFTTIRNWIMSPNVSDW